MNANLNKTIPTNSFTKLTSISKAILVAGIVAGISLPVASKNRNYDGGNYNNSNNVTYDYAKVVDVAPVLEAHQVNQPIEQCWDERVPKRTRYSERRRNGQTQSYTGEILGALIGAAAGNQFGNGRGKKVATAAGAVLGGSIARDIKNGAAYTRSNRGHGGYQVVQRCELQDSYTTQQQVVGYDVSYKYRGNVFHTQMDQHPGDKIKVMVTVNPL